jgi:hypothetical protein
MYSNGNGLHHRPQEDRSMFEWDFCLPAGMILLIGSVSAGFLLDRSNALDPDSFSSQALCFVGDVFFVLGVLALTLALRDICRLARKKREKRT